MPAGVSGIRVFRPGDTLHALAWLVPGEVALFGLDELEAAKQWAAG